MALDTSSAKATQKEGNGMGIMKIEHVLRKMSDVLAFVGGLCLVAAMFVIARSVIGRYFFSSPLMMGDDIAGLLMLVAMLAGVSFAIYSDLYPSVDIFLVKFPWRVKLIVSLMSYIFALAFYAVILLEAAEMAPTAFAGHLKSSPPLYFPLGPVYLLIVVNALLAVLHLLGFAIRTVGRMLRTGEVQSASQGTSNVIF